MPMPMPHDDDDHDGFMDRCMADPAMNDEFSDPAQRQAVCEKQWEGKGKKDEGVAMRPAKYEWLRVAAKPRPTGVDREGRRINGFIVAEAGPFRTPGRGEFDGKALRQIVKLMKSEPNGLKSRFGHPDMSGDALGTYIGRARDPWIDKIYRNGADVVEVVRADLHLAESSFEKNPNGNLGEWIMTAAEEDPEGALGASLVLTVDEEMRLDKKGQPLRDEEGNELPPLWRPKELHAADLTDTGDATRSFLAAGIDAGQLPDSVVRQTTTALRRLFRGMEPAEVYRRCEAYLERYMAGEYGWFKPTAVDPLSNRFPNRRFQILHVSPDVFVGMCKDGDRQFCVSNGLPDDSEVVRVSYDQLRDVIALTIYSAQFDSLRDGAVIPICRPPEFSSLPKQPQDESHDPKRRKLRSWLKKVRIGQ